MGISGTVGGFRRWVTSIWKYRHVVVRLKRKEKKRIVLELGSPLQNTVIYREKCTGTCLFIVISIYIYGTGSLNQYQSSCPQGQRE